MPTENKTAEPLPTLATGKEPKPYPDRLCHIDYTTHPHRCGCLSGDEEAQRRFDEYQRDTKLATAEGEVARLTAERDALQQRMNAADQRIDELEREEKAPLDPPQPITEQFIEDHLGKMPVAQRGEP
ncbi:hypothetical protein FCH79_00960 [Pseudomonas koreensis]|uniref:hypothetical protein n=1 Tax=Pseudomonas koreensis TaxID=198620 RepID=UPI001577524C|nr:hypothetical protein [Pseudomonas koreensis]NTZ93894.1 hypothetical protein [Pseudomonas koreensis]